jgi:hypothetical protein
MLYCARDTRPHNIKSMLGSPPSMTAAKLRSTCASLQDSIVKLFDAFNRYHSYVPTFRSANHRRPK